MGISIFPLALPSNLNPMPDHYLKLLPTYNAEKKRMVEGHLDSFQNFVDKCYVEHEYVYMRFFLQSLDGDVRK